MCSSDTICYVSLQDKVPIKLGTHEAGAEVSGMARLSAWAGRADLQSTPESEDVGARLSLRMLKQYVLYVYVYVCMYVCMYVYIYIYIHIFLEGATLGFRSLVSKPQSFEAPRADQRSLLISSNRTVSTWGSLVPEALLISEGGMIGLETLIELKFLNSSFSSLSSRRNWTNGSLSSSSRQQYLSQQYPPPLLSMAFNASKLPASGLIFPRFICFNI